MNDTYAHAFFGAPFGDPDPETGLPTVEVNPPIAAALTAAGWLRDPANIEDEYVEGDWVVHVGTRAYSIEPSGHHRSVIVHRGPVCDSAVFTINQNSPTPIPAAVVVAAVNALIADDRPYHHQTYRIGDHVEVCDRCGHDWPCPQSLDAPAEVPTGWGYLDCIARAIYHLPLSRTAQVTPREAADLVLAELTKQGYKIGTEVEDVTSDLSAPPPPMADVTDEAARWLVTHRASVYQPGDRVLLGRPGVDDGVGTVAEFVADTNVEILGGREAVYSVLVDGEAEPRRWGTGWMRPGTGQRPPVYLDPEAPTAKVDSFGLDAYLVERAEHDAHAGDRPEPEE